jgi:hypothetical protein
VETVDQLQQLESLRHEVAQMKQGPVQSPRPIQAQPAAMGKEKMAALERAKKATSAAKGKKTSRGRSSSRSGLPPGWIQGDWIRSTIWKEDMEDLVEGGLIPHQSWRLPGNETEP